MKCFLNWFSFKPFVVFIIVLNVYQIETKVVSQFKLCADIECKEPISTGRTSIPYKAIDPGSVTFKQGIDVTIFAETEDKKYFDIEVNGKRGLAPKQHILVQKVLNKNPQNVVKIDYNSESLVQNDSNGDTNEDLINQTNSAEDINSSELFPSLSENTAEMQSNTPTKDDFTVVDGTTLPYYEGMDDDLSVSTTVQSGSTTATKTATISLNLDNSPEVKPNEDIIESSLLSNSTENESISNEMKESIETLDEIRGNEEVINSSQTTGAINSSETTESQEERTDSVDESDVSVETKDSINSSETNDSIDSSVEFKESSVETNDSISASVETNNSINSNDSISSSAKVNDSIVNSNASVEANDSISASVETNDSKSVSDDNQNVNIGSSIDDKVMKDKINETSEQPVVESEDNSSQTFDNTSQVLTQELNETSAEGTDSLLNVSESALKSDLTSDINTENENNISVESSEIVNQMSDKIDDNLNKSSDNSIFGLNSSEDNNKTDLNLVIDDNPNADTKSDINVVQNETNSLTNTSSEGLVTNSDSIDSNVNSFSDSNQNQFNSVVNESEINTNDENKENIETPTLNDINIDDISDSFKPVVSEDMTTSAVSHESDEYLKGDQTMDSMNTIIDENIAIVDELKAPELNPQVMIESNDIFKWMGLEGMAVLEVISTVVPDSFKQMLQEFQISAQVVVFIAIIAFNWCLMKIIVSLFNSRSKETELRDKCCKTERKLYYFEAEKQKLLKDIETETEKSRKAEERLHTIEHKFIPLEKDYLKLKSEREQMHQKVVSLESELESTTEAGLEANRLLNDFLTSQKENVNLNSSVDALQQQINKQTEIVSKYESTARQKEQENSKLREKVQKLSKELERMANVVKESENNLQIFQRNNKDLKETKSDLNSTLTQLEEQYSSLQSKSDEYIERNDKLMNDLKDINEEMKSIKDQMLNKDLEIESLKEILVKVRKTANDCKHIDGEDGDADEIDARNAEAFNDLFDFLKIELQLKEITNNRNELVSQLDCVNQRCDQLNATLSGLEENNKVLKNERESAVQDKVKAQMELEVLSKYYKEKELELGKEIGVQQVQRLQKEEDVNSMAYQLSSFEDENVSLRSQLQSMKREVEETERKYKTQINQLEKQVHENWILARSAERKYEESKAEASVLRQTLTMSAKSPMDGFADSSFMDDSASSVSSLHEHFGAGVPPPPPPPFPPPPPIFNQLMPGMHMPFEDTDPSLHWNQSMNSMPIPSHFPQMQNNFNPIPTDGSMGSMSNNPIIAYNSMGANTQQMNFVPNIQNQWDSSSNRDTYSPSSHRSNNSPQSLPYNMYSQTHNHYSNPMSNQMTNSMTTHSMVSPLQNTSVQSVNILSEPIPSHWNRPNGTVPNLDYSHNQYNETADNSSRPTSRAETSSTLHTSIV